MIIILCLIGCLLMFIICYLGTGNDDKNLNGLRSYPIELQKLIRKDYKGKIREKSKLKIFINNIFVFSIILFLFGLFIKSDKFIYNFINILILGEFINLFDLFVINLIWFRNTKRVRFTLYQDEKLYKDIKIHFYSFFRAIFLFVIVAFIDGIVLTCI